MELAELAARLDEDEKAALISKQAPAGEMRFVDADPYSEPLVYLVGEDRMLREVAFKRELLVIAEEADDIHYDRMVEVGADVPEVLIGERIRRCLAAVYDDAAPGTR